MATTTGTKGSDVYTFDGVNDPRVALYVQLVRGQTEEIINTGLKKIIYCSDTNITDYDKLLEDAIVLTFMTRNIRGGKGERDVGMHMLKTLYMEKPEIILNLFDLLFSCLQDLFQFYLVRLA